VSFLFYSFSLSLFFFGEPGLFQKTTLLSFQYFGGRLENKLFAHSNIFNQNLTFLHFTFLLSSNNSYISRADIIIPLTDKISLSEFFRIIKQAKKYSISVVITCRSFHL
jgi:hypothetical protein